jgi:hypothetical protein
LPGLVRCWGSATRDPALPSPSRACVAAWTVPLICSVISLPSEAAPFKRAKIDFLLRLFWRERSGAPSLTDVSIYQQTTDAGLAFFCGGLLAGKRNMRRVRKD